MTEADYYPAGAYNDPRAPWNQVPRQEEEFTIEVYSTITRTADIKSKDYEYDCCDLPKYDGNAVDDFRDQCYSIKDLLNVLFNYIVKDIENETDKWRLQHLNHLIDEVQAWEEGDEEINEA